MARHASSTPKEDQRLVRFFAPVTLVEALEDRAKREERTLSQELRHLVARHLNDERTAA